jgi:hypothetical protein
VSFIRKVIYKSVVYIIIHCNNCNRNDLLREVLIEAGSPDLEGWTAVSATCIHLSGSGKLSI